MAETRPHPPLPGKMTREAIDRAAHYAIESDLLAPEDWEAAGLYDFAHALTGGIGVVDDLRTLVARLAQSLRQAAPGHALPAKAVDYLLRHGLAGSPLRDGQPAATCTDCHKPTACQECGMVCTPGEFHPYAACLMFKACHDGEKVRANLAFVRDAPTPICADCHKPTGGSDGVHTCSPQVAGDAEDAARLQWLLDSDSLAHPGVDMAAAFHSGDDAAVRAAIDRDRSTGQSCAGSYTNDSEKDER